MTKEDLDDIIDNIYSIVLNLQYLRKNMKYLYPKYVRQQAKERDKMYVDSLKQIILEIAGKNYD
jgi:hypothetical protein